MEKFNIWLKVRGVVPLDEQVRKFSEIILLFNKAKKLCNQNIDNRFDEMEKLLEKTLYELIRLSKAVNGQSSFPSKQRAEAHEFLSTVSGKIQCIGEEIRFQMSCSFIRRYLKVVKEFLLSTVWTLTKWRGGISSEEVL